MMPGEGVVAVMDTVNSTQMFGGLIYPRGAGWEGQMHDTYGTSALEDIRLSESIISFTKRYNGHRDVIEYSFKREGDVWSGCFTGEVVGEGPAVCIFTPVPGEML